MRPATVAIVGGETLIAREIRDVFSEHAPELTVKVTGIEDSETGDDAVEMLDKRVLGAASIAVLAGNKDSSKQVVELAAGQSRSPALIDLSYALEDRPGARVRAPWAEAFPHPPPLSRENVIAHPAASVLAVFFRRLRSSFAVRRWVVLILEPVSERGKRGLNELERQTAHLLSFRPLPKDVFDEQLSFNVLARYGSEAPESLLSIELRIERHLATLLAGAGLMPMPSLRLIQAPVFHGYSFSVWVEFEDTPGAAELARALASQDIDVRTDELDAPTNVGAAGQSGITVGVIETDRNDPRCAWFWIVADNHRITAENALRLARELLAAEGRA